MASAFDPYYTWLGIAPAEQPANYYRLLGLRCFEDNADVIEHAADRQMGHLRTVASGAHGMLAQKLLTEVASARVCLLDATQKQRYDAALRAAFSPPPIAAAPPPHVASPALAVVRAATPATTLESAAETVHIAPAKPSAVRIRRRNQSPAVIVGVCAAVVVGIAIVALSNWPNESREVAVDVGGSKAPRNSRNGDNAAKAKVPASPAQSDFTDTPEVGAPADSDIEPATPPAAAPRAPEPDAPARAKTTEAEPPIKPAPVAPQDEDPPGVEPDQSADVGPKRSPAPTAAEYTAHEKEVRRLLAAEFAKSKTPEVWALAQRLLLLGRETRNDAAARYVLLDLSRKFAIKIGDSVTARAAVEELAQQHAINELELLSETLLDVSKSRVMATARPALATNLDHAATRAVAANRFDLAGKLNDAFSVVVKQNRDEDAIARSAARGEIIVAASKEWPGVESALETLETLADDQQAMNVVGRFYCFTKQDWEKGLPLLAKGSDGTLRGLAEADLRTDQSESAMVATGNGWWDYANALSGIQQRAATRRAGDFYSRAFPKLKGLDRTAVEQRLNASKIEHWISRDARYVVIAEQTDKKFPPLSSLLDDSEQFHQVAPNGPFAFQGSGYNSHIVIDLGKSATITRIEIVNRQVQNRNKGMTVSLGNTPKGPWKKIWFAEKDLPSWEIQAPHDSHARYLRVGLREGRNDDCWFNLKKVKIFGYE